MTKRINDVVKILFILIAVFAFLDLTPSFINGREGIIQALWWVVIAAVALVYYVLRKDKSEAIAIFAVGAIELVSGLEDFIYFTIQKLQGIVVDTCVNANLNNLTLYKFGDQLLGNNCITYAGLALNITLASVVAYYVYSWLIDQ